MCDTAVLYKFCYLSVFTDKVVTPTPFPLRTLSSFTTPHTKHTHTIAAIQIKDTAGGVKPRHLMHFGPYTTQSSYTPI